MALNFNEITEQDQCPVYFASLAAFTDLTEVAQLTRNYRTAHSAYAKGFVIDIGTIRDLLAQNGGNISGIKLYMGQEIIGTFRGIAIATVGPSYDDYNIPNLVTDPCNAILGEARPCPVSCGAANALNR